MENQVEDTLDLSHQKLKKLNKCRAQDTQITNLILDDNELQRLDNIDSFTKLQKLSAVRNQLLRMYAVCRLHCLQSLNLSHNGILTIEGLKDLVNLQWLCLAGNSIKTIEHLNTNLNLEHLDLSMNHISHVGDLSSLKNLKELLLHNNKIGHLRQCDRFLPASLTTLTLANNNIEDLNEISQLGHLVNLLNISIANNPCVTMSNNSIGFDYRPFVINWCLNVKTIDGYCVDAIESLRAEWLYSQGRGRHFRVGDQKALGQYLASVCPLTGEQLETEEDRKLRLILSKAQHHQQQLREQSFETSTPSPVSRKRVLSASKHSPRLNSARSAHKIKSPDRMTSSFYGNATTTTNSNSSIMSQSLDPSLLRQTLPPSSASASGSSREKCLDAGEAPVNSPLQAASKMVPVPESLMSPDFQSPHPLITDNLPTPLMPIVVNSKALPKSGQVAELQRSSPKLNARKSPLRGNNKTASPPTNSPSPARSRKILDNKQQQLQQQQQQKNNVSPSILRKSASSDDECSETFASKLQMIQIKAEEKRQIQKDTVDISSNTSSEDKTEQAAVCIQKMWRGYYARNRDKEVQEIYRTIQSQRAGQYIQQLNSDMQTTKAALESERKIQMLQTEAISALWKQVSALQPTANGQSKTGDVILGDGSGDPHVVKELAETCNILKNQMQLLQNSMQDMMKVMTIFQQQQQQQTPPKENGIAVTQTQTEIVAVHTPQGDAAKIFPFQKQVTSARPSSLPLPVCQRGAKKEASHNESTTTANYDDLHQYAEDLVGDVIKTVSETRADSIGPNTIEVTVLDLGKDIDESLNS